MRWITADIVQEVDAAPGDDDITEADGFGDEEERLRQIVAAHRKTDLNIDVQLDDHEDGAGGVETIIINDDGVEVELYLIAEFTLDDVDYCLWHPINFDEEAEDTQVYVFACVGLSKGTRSLAPVEDPERLAAVRDRYIAMLEEESEGFDEA